MFSPAKRLTARYVLTLIGLLCFCTQSLASEKPASGQPAQ